MIEDMWNGAGLRSKVSSLFDDVREAMGDMQEEVCIQCGKKSFVSDRKCPHCGNCKGCHDD